MENYQIHLIAYEASIHLQLNYSKMFKEYMRLSWYHYFNDFFAHAFLKGDATGKATWTIPKDTNA